MLIKPTKDCLKYIDRTIINISTIHSFESNIDLNYLRKGFLLIKDAIWSSPETFSTNATINCLLTVDLEHVQNQTAQI